MIKSKQESCLERTLGQNSRFRYLDHKSEENIKSVLVFSIGITLVDVHLNWLN